MMAFKITGCKFWLDTLKTMNSSLQPSHLSSTNHSVRASVTRWWGRGLWFLLLFRQSPAVGTWASYFCPELQRALDIELCLKVWPFTPVSLAHFVCPWLPQPSDVHLQQVGKGSPGLGRASQEGILGFLRCVTPAESTQSLGSSLVFENLPTDVACVCLLPKYGWVNLSRCKCCNCAYFSVFVLGGFLTCCVHTCICTRHSVCASVAWVRPLLSNIYTAVAAGSLAKPRAPWC